MSNKLHSESSADIISHYATIQTKSDTGFVVLDHHNGQTQKFDLDNKSMQLLTCGLEAFRQEQDIFLILEGKRILAILDETKSRILYIVYGFDPHKFIEFKQKPGEGGHRYQAPNIFA